MNDNDDLRGKPIAWEIVVPERIRVYYNRYIDNTDPIARRINMDCLEILGYEIVDHNLYYNGMRVAHIVNTL